MGILADLAKKNTGSKTDRSKLGVKDTDTGKDKSKSTKEKLGDSTKGDANGGNKESGKAISAATSQKTDTSDGADADTGKADVKATEPTISQKSSYAKTLQNLDGWDFMDYLTGLMNSEDEVATRYRDRHNIDYFDPYADYGGLAEHGGAKIWSRVYNSSPEAQAAYIQAYGDEIDTNNDLSISDDEARAFWELNEKRNNNVDVTDILDDESVQRVYGYDPDTGSINQDIWDAMNQKFYTQSAADEIDRLLSSNVSADDVASTLINERGMASEAGNGLYDTLTAAIAAGYNSGETEYDSAFAQANNAMKLIQLADILENDSYDGQSLLGTDASSVASSLTGLLNNVAGGSSGLALVGENDTGLNNSYAKLNEDSGVNYIDLGTRQAYNGTATKQNVDVAESIDRLLDDNSDIDASLLVFLANELNAGDKSLTNQGYTTRTQRGDMARDGSLTGEQLGKLYHTDHVDEYGNRLLPDGTPIYAQ